MGLASGSFLGKTPPLTETSPPGDQGLSPLIPAPLIPLKSWWHVAPSPAHSLRQVLCVCLYHWIQIQLEIYGKETTREVTAFPCALPACAGSSPSPPAWPEFMETSQVSDSHLPFLPWERGAQPLCSEPGTFCLKVPLSWDGVL